MIFLIEISHLRLDENISKVSSSRISLVVVNFGLLYGKVDPCISLIASGPPPLYKR